MLDITRFIHKHTRGFNCQVIRQFDGLTRICGWKQRKPWPTTISVIGLLVSPRCFTPALMFARESWYSLFPVLSDTTWPTQICLLISNYNSDSTVILPSFHDVYQYWNYYSGFFFYKIHRSISNCNYTTCAINARRYNWHYISYYVWIYPFKNTISREIIIFTDVFRKNRNKPCS